MKSIFTLLVLTLGVTFGVSAQMNTMKSDGNPMVGGAAMFKTKNIVENAVNSKDHTTLVAAVVAAGLVDTLKSAGPFTVFAPVNSAFDKLPVGTVDTLLKPENKALLTKILTYHVIAGNFDSVRAPGTHQPQFRSASCLEQPRLPRRVRRPDDHLCPSALRGN